MVGRERIIPHQDGNDGFGILHDTGDANSSLIVFVNAGIVHRTGPHRLYVKLAREFARQGLCSFRFDLSGLGDSAAPTLDYEAQALADIQGAIDLALSALKTPRNVILLGLCSGSENAYKAALRDDRVKGLILLDPHSYETRSSKIEKLAGKVTDPSRVGRALGRAIGIAPAAPDQPDEPQLVQVIDRPDPPREVWAADLATLKARQVPIYIRYTRFVEEDLTRPEHFFEAFSELDLKDSVTVDVDRGADHTYTPLAAQKRLMAACCDWLEKHAR